MKKDREAKDKFSSYPKTAFYRVIDTIGVPHPYMITSAHVCIAADEYSGMLTADAIRGAEERGAKCDICRAEVKAGRQRDVLKYDEHGQALLIECKKDDTEALKKYLLLIKDQAEKDHYKGFCFLKAF
jgi:hypothetical protein